MRKIPVLMTIAIMFILVVPNVYSFDPKEGFYAEYRIEGTRPQDSSVFALLKDQSLQIKYINLTDIVYKYQILDMRGDVAEVRISLEGTLHMGGYENREEIKIPFKKIFDIKLDLSTLEMIDENGNSWGKWLFWIKLGSYNWKEYTLMKNWNNHGEVKGWLKGPWENITLSKFLRSSYASTLNHYFVAITSKKEEDTWIYPKFEEYGIAPSYKAHETEEGTIRIEPGGYYLGGFEVSSNTEEEGTKMSGIITRYYYTDEGLFFEHILPYYIDDFLDQKLGITVLKVSDPFTLVDSGVTDEILIEDPTPENQISLLEEVKKHLKESENSSETPITESPQKTESPQSTQEKSETPLATTRQSNDTEKTNTLYYVAPLLVVAVIAVFLVLKEKR